MKQFLFAALIMVALLPLCAWDSGCQSNDDKVSVQQEQMQSQTAAQVGMPGITNFTEMKMLRHLYELRDQAISTYTYVPDMNGKLWHLCDSVGFGIPYSAQFSSSEKATEYAYPMPQAEPNGLFMPASAEGTWVMCGAKSGTQPVYVESRIIVSTIKLRAAGEYAAD